MDRRCPPSHMYRRTPTTARPGCVPTHVPCQSSFHRPRPCNAIGRKLPRPPTTVHHWIASLQTHPLGCNTRLSKLENLESEPQLAGYGPRPLPQGLGSQLPSPTSKVPTYPYPYPNIPTSSHSTASRALAHYLLATYDLRPTTCDLRPVDRSTIYLPNSRRALETKTHLVVCCVLNLVCPVCCVVLNPLPRPPVETVAPTAVPTAARLSPPSL
ncbi:hypothetical protein F4859DRAFT_260859 [Xylaria cf. heliscus]|nr:hypothetical protein F4859DRAFT_260859 [Xylaria cf. heliscus]